MRAAAITAAPCISVSPVESTTYAAEYAAAKLITGDFLDQWAEHADQRRHIGHSRIVQRFRDDNR